MHGIEVIKIAPIFLEPVRGRQGLGGIAKMVLAELACGVAKIEQELGEVRRDGLPGISGKVMPTRTGGMPAMKAVRPAVQLCSA